MTIPELNNFALVGGTNLSLQLGYRLSVDIGLFTNKPFDISGVKAAIGSHFGNATKLDEMKQTLWYQINGVKTDIILHEYPYLNPVIELEGIRLLSIPDIIPMKLGALAGRGAKKDFWDIAELLDHYTIRQMLEFYKAKYTSDDVGFIVRSMVYFDDADIQSDPVSLKKTTWNSVKKKMQAAVKKYIAEETT